MADYVLPILDHLESSRPTAVNLGEAMNRIRATILETTGSEGQGEDAAGRVVSQVMSACGAVHDEDLKRNMEMGRLGAEWLWKKRRQGNQVDAGVNGHGEKGLKVLTVCNTGSLATSVSRHSLRRLKKLEAGAKTVLGIWYSYWCHYVVIRAGSSRESVLRPDDSISPGCACLFYTRAFLIQARF